MEWAKIQVGSSGARASAWGVDRAGTLPRRAPSSSSRRRGRRCFWEFGFLGFATCEVAVRASEEMDGRRHRGDFGDGEDEKEEGGR